MYIYIYICIYKIYIYREREREKKKIIYCRKKCVFHFSLILTHFAILLF